MYWGSNRKSVSLSRKNKSPSHSYIVCDASSIGSLGQAIAQNTTSGPVKPEVGFLAAVSATNGPRCPATWPVAARAVRCRRLRGARKTGGLIPGWRVGYCPKPPKLWEVLRKIWSSDLDQSTNLHTSDNLLP